MKPFFARCVLTLALLLGGTGCTQDWDRALQVSGQIEGRTVTGGSAVGGRVEAVLAREGDTVEAGAILLELEANEAQAAVDAAKAAQAQAEAALAKLENGATNEELHQAEAASDAARAQLQLVEAGARREDIEAARAAAEAAAAQRAIATHDNTRTQELLSRGVASRQQADQMAKAADAADAHYRQTREQVAALANGARPEEIAMAQAEAARADAALAEIRRGAREEDIAQAQAAVDATAADVRRAETALAEMTITAPITGVVESLDVRVGDLVRSGPLVRLIDPEDLEVTIYVSAAVLGRLRVGQDITLTADAFDTDTKFHATIAHIAAEGEFTPRNLQTREERVQQVFGVKLRLDAQGGKLRAGMTVTAHFPAAS